MSQPTACPNCATPLQGRYCHACGQKRIEPEARGIEFDAYALEYQAEATNLARVLVILHAPLFALILLALHFRRGRYLVDHLAVSLHFWAFLLFVVMVLHWILWAMFRVTGLGSPALLQSPG